MPESDVVSAVSKGANPMGALVQRYESNRADAKADSAKYDQQIEGVQKRLEKSQAEGDEATRVARLPGGALVPPKLDPAPAPKQTGLLEMFGSPAMWIASFGGLMTRNPMKTSLNAAAGVMNAYRERDFATAQKQYDAWKVETSNALKLHDFQLDTYKTAMDKVKTDSNGALAELRTYAAAYNDKTTQRIADTGDMKLIFDHLHALQHHGDALRSSMPAVERFNAEAQALGALTQARQGLEAAKRTGDPAKVQSATEAVEAAKTRMQDVQRAYQPGYAASEMRTTAAGAKADAKAADKRQAVVDNYDLAIDQIDNLIKMAQANEGVTGLGGRGRRLLETGMGMVGAGDGKTPASDFQSALETFRLEAPKLITGASKSAKDERARIDTVLRGTSAGDTRDKTVNSLNQVRDLLTKRRDGLKSGTEAVEGEEGGATKAPASLIEDARALLKNGAPKADIEKILRDQGVDPSELGL